MTEDRELLRRMRADLDALSREIMRAIPVRIGGSSPSSSSGGAQIVQFTIDSVDCDAGAASGTVTDVLCAGAVAAVGDSISLVDPLGYLVGNPALLINHKGIAVSMSEDGPYGAACVYKIISMDDLGYNC